MRTQIPARINGALRAAAKWASDRDIGTERVRRGAVLCVPIVTCVALLGSRVLGRLVYRRRAIVVLGLALAIPVGALEYRSWVRENEPPRGGKNESVEENARIAKWRRSVEQAPRAVKASSLSDLTVKHLISLRFSFSEPLENSNDINVLG